MQRPFTYAARLGLVAALSLAAAGAAAGGGSSNVGAKRTASNTFNVVYSAQAPGAAVVVPSNGVSVSPGKAVVTNPYNVPLFKDAGTLGSR